MRIIVEEYNTKWKKFFEVEKEILTNVLKEYNPQIEHIGSTSVEGLCAKPIIDIMIGVQKIEHLNQSIEKLINLGYIYIKKFEEVMPFRRFFIKIRDKDRYNNIPSIIDFGDELLNREKYNNTHHIHIVEINSEFWNRHLLFRDYLRINEEVRNQYCVFKKDLSKREWKDSDEYVAAKTEFIKFIEIKARKEKLGNFG